MAVPRVPDIRASMAEVGKTPGPYGSVLFRSFAGEGRERGNFSLRCRPIQRVRPVPFHVAPEPLLGELAYARRPQRRSTRSSGARRRPICPPSRSPGARPQAPSSPPPEPVEVRPVRAEYDGVLDDRRRPRMKGGGCGPPEKARDRRRDKERGPAVTRDDHVSRWGASDGKAVTVSPPGDVLVLQIGGPR